MFKTLLIVAALVVSFTIYKPEVVETPDPAQCEFYAPTCDFDASCATVCASLTGSDYCSCIASCYQCGPTPLP